MKIYLFLVFYLVGAQLFALVVPSLTEEGSLNKHQRMNHIETKMIDLYRVVVKMEGEIKQFAESIKKLELGEQKNRQQDQVISSLAREINDLKKAVKEIGDAAKKEKGEEEGGKEER